MGGRFSGATPAEAHERLVASAFHVIAIPWAAPTDRTGGQRWHLLDGQTTAERSNPQIACENVYEHRDGGVVRIFPSPFRCLGSGIVGPAARKSVITPPDLRPVNDASLDMEIFAVTRTGEPVPKSCATEHGMPEEKDALMARVHARSMLERVRIELAPGPPVEASRMIAGLGLLPGRTVATHAPFEEVLDHARRLVSTGVRDAPLVLAEGTDAVRIYCPGHEEDVASGAALTCLSFVHATGTIGVDASGYEASRRQLGTLLVLLLGRYPGRIFENATGQNLSERLARITHRLYSPDVRTIPLARTELS